MRFRFIWIGKTKNANWRALQEEYLRRLSHFIKHAVIEIKDTAGGRNRIEAESSSILSALGPQTYAVLMDISGDSVSSESLAKKIEKLQASSVKDVVFIIGGAEGVSPAVAERADYRLSLSFLTFTHEMARVVLLEQLYRAFSIINGYPYQK
jgi:23S rRNA (pseudouridine1915-N3)-methyltransferase